MNYTGPVVYIVHSPPPKVKFIDLESQKTVDKYAEHVKKIKRLLKFAKRFGLPVFWELSSDANIERLMLDLKFTREELGSANVIPAPSEKDLLAALDTKRPFESKSVYPTKFIFAGWAKEMCILVALSRLKYAYPDARMVILRGDFSLSSNLIFGHQTHENLRKEMQKRRKVFPFRVSTLGKKLLK